MKVQLIQGEFNSPDAIQLISNMINLKIKYQEGQIEKNNNEEDIKYRESKIKNLQNELFELRNFLSTKENVKIDASINLE
ncbi:MAG: hypothetical protein FGM14_05120 [Flavobacteriales bacterium]|nr:hypothetical protein [Flavobacteriales bacterium]